MLSTGYKQKEWKHIGIAFGLTAVAAIAGIAACSFSFLIGSDYAKHTIRGGQNISIEGDSVKADKTTGLDTSYAFQYSFTKAEPLVMLMPNAFGGSSATPLDENSNVIKKLTDKGLTGKHRRPGSRKPAKILGWPGKYQRSGLYWRHHLPSCFDWFCVSKTSLAMGVVGSFCIGHHHVMG